MTRALLLVPLTALTYGCLTPQAREPVPTPKSPRPPRARATSREPPAPFQMPNKLSPPTALTLPQAFELADRSHPEIARILNMKKLQTPRGLPWTQERVTSFRKQHRICTEKKLADPDCLTMNESQAYLGIGHNALLALVKRGVISPNQLTEFAPWRVSRAQLDSQTVQSLVKVLKETGRLPRGGSPKNQLTFFD